jgi:hypothetical protein
MKSESSEGFEITPRAMTREDQERSSSDSLACTCCNWYIDGEGWHEEEMSRKAPCRLLLRRPFRPFCRADASVNRT